MTRPTLERATFASVIAVGAASAGIALGAFGARVAFSIAVGAGIAVLNLWALRGVVRSLVAAAAQTERGAGLGFFLGPKLVALLALTWILLARHTVSAGGFAIGFSALPIGVAIGALVCEKPPED